MIGSYGGGIYTSPPNFRCLTFLWKTNFIVRFLRIHPVQKVLDNPTQLSGRGFPRIFHMKLVLSQLYVFWYFKMLQGGRRNYNIIFLLRFLSIHPVQKVINNPTQLSGRRFPRSFHMKFVLSQLYVFFVLQNGSRAVNTRSHVWEAKFYKLS